MLSRSPLKEVMNSVRCVCVFWFFSLCRVLGVVLSASMNAVIQGVVAAAAWAGAGLVPAK